MTTQDKIRNMQTFLNKYYKANLKVDGIYGPKTKAAVKNMQRQLGGIDVDGWWGAETQKAVANSNANNRRIAPEFGAARNANGLQDTTPDDLAFMYKNPPSKNTAPTNTATPASSVTPATPAITSSNASNSTSSSSLNSQPAQSGNVNKWYTGNGPIPWLINRFLYDDSTQGAWFGKPYTYKDGSRTVYKNGGKILMNYITK